MSNIVHFPTDYTEIDAMSLSQRLFMIEQLHEDMQTELDRMSDANAKMKDLLAANKKWLLERE